MTIINAVNGNGQKGPNGRQPGISTMPSFVESMRETFTTARRVFGVWMGREVDVNGTNTTSFSWYMTDTGRYAALHGLVCEHAKAIANAGVVLNISATTGHVAAQILRKIGTTPLPDGKKRVLIVNEVDGRLLGHAQEKIEKMLEASPEISACTEVRFCSHDPTNFPGDAFPERSVDAIIWATGIHYAKDRSGVTKEAWRILRKNGTFAMFDESPFIEVPERYATEEGSIELKLMVRPVDMGEITRGHVSDMWAQAAGQDLPQMREHEPAFDTIRDQTRPDIHSRMVRIVFEKLQD